MHYKGSKPSINITLNGDFGVFAPNWDLVSKLRNNKISKSEFKRKYYALMKKSYRENFEAWNDIVKLDELVLKCYCPPGEFCHRYLLVNLLEGVAEFNAIGFEYVGEINKIDELIIGGEEIGKNM